MKLAGNKLILLGLSLVAAGLVSTAVFMKLTSPKTGTVNSESSANPDGTPKDNQSDPEAPSDPPPAPSPAAGGQPDSQTPSAIKPVITTLAADGGFVRLRVMIEKVLSGNCAVTFAKDSARVERSAPTQVQAEQSVCQGFDIPRSEFSSGTWSVTVRVTASGYDETSETKTITLE